MIDSFLIFCTVVSVILLVFFILGLFLYNDGDSLPGVPLYTVKDLRLFSRRLDNWTRLRYEIGALTHTLTGLFRDTLRGIGVGNKRSARGAIVMAVLFLPLFFYVSYRWIMVLTS